MTILDHPSRSAGELLDTDAMSAELGRLARDFAGRERELRIAVAQRLKAAHADARIVAEQLLLEDRNGRRCAERLCRLQDDIIMVLYDFVAKHLYPSQSPSDAEHMAVVATGGYGRGLMAPGSDIDLLFLLPYKQTAWGESIAEAILYCLWDMGLKVGHATRSIDECIRQAKADMTIRTALREERHRRAGQSRYLVEPNVKDGKGGLRDLHTLFWMAKYVYRVREPDELLEHGVFDRREYQLFRRCENFLWAVRCHMHFVTGRAEERLAFDIQRDIAVRLGYTAHPGMKDVERFMKHYFLIAKDVGDLTAILCAELEDSHAKSVPVLSRVLARFRPSKRRTLLDSKDFVVDHNRINVANPKVFQRDPLNLIRIFHLAQRHGLAFHPDAMRLATRSLRLIDKSMR